MKHRDRVNAAPNITADHWEDLSKICASREAFPALLGYILSLAQDLHNSTLHMRTGTPEQKEEVDKIKGQVLGYQAIVGDICDKMGDAMIAADEEEEDAQYEDYETGPRKRYVRAVTPHKPVRMKTTRAKTAAKKVAKKRK